MAMKSYPPEFKADAVALYLSDPSRTYASVGRDLGVHPETLRLWVREARANGTAGARKKGSVEEPASGPLSSDDVLEAENKQLKARIRELELERDILRKAAKYFGGRDELVSRFQFVADHRDAFGVKRLCRVLSVSRSAVAWLKAASLDLASLEDAKTVRLALHALTLCLDGSAAASTTIARKRAVFHALLEYAVELEELSANPLHKVKWKPPKTTETVDPRVVVNPRQAQELLTAVTYVGRRGRGRRLMALFACMYYAALRPAEAVGLRIQDCHLPASGWGRLTIDVSRPEVNTQWTDSGDAHEERGLKHRGRQDVRPVPIPPELVEILREHIAEYGIAKDGRIFSSERGGVVASTAYTEVWQDARLLAFTPAQVASPLAKRPYDLRHAAVSLWLNAGVSAPDVAERAGHSVDVLLRVYAKCIDGQQEIANKRIGDALAA
ncbi:transposase [Nonomuraea sp. B10E15]|uniref:transposase n=1 Tax=Nonomuraea sp. B10E15 TaxID=3153560 RepID=UPI00325F5DCA